MPKTLRDTRRHMAEWSSFFSDVGSAAVADVHAFVEQRKEKRRLVQSFARLKARGFLVERGDRVMPTAAGSRFFRRYMLHKRRRELPGSWDGKWRLVSYDVPVGKNHERYQLRALLAEFGFYQLHKSVWVCPNAVGEEWWKLIVAYGLDRYCKVMVVDIIEGDEELRAHFKLTS